MKCNKGYKQSGNKCVKRNSHSGKKSYNPFKMWGSYLGLVLINILPLPLFVWGELGFVMGFKFWIVLFTEFFFVPIILNIFGFLLGWAIHSIIRRIRK